MGLSVTGFFFEIDVSFNISNIYSSSIFSIALILCIPFHFYEQSSDNSALVPIIDALSNVANADSNVEFSNSGFRLDQLIDGVAPVSGDTTPYSTYSGSLTTPTCNEVKLSFKESRIRERHFQLFK